MLIEEGKDSAGIIAILRAEAVTEDIETIQFANASMVDVAADNALPSCLVIVVDDWINGIRWRGDRPRVERVLNEALAQTPSVVFSTTRV